MLASDLSDGLFGAAAVLIGGSVFWLVVGKRLSRVSAEWHDAKVTIESAVETKVAEVTKPMNDAVCEIRDIVQSQSGAIGEINDAVNHKLPHDPTLLQRVKGLEITHEGLHARVGGLETGQAEMRALLKEHIDISRGFQRTVAAVVGVPFPEVPHEDHQE